MPQWSEKQQTLLIWALRFFGFAVGGVVTALGLYYLISKRDTTGSVDDIIKNCVLDIYRIIFGLLIMLAELSAIVPPLRLLLAWFSFLLYYIGLGFFYWFIGGLALGDAWYEWVVTIVACIVGCGYCGVACCCADLERRHQETVKANVDTAQL